MGDSALPDSIVEAIAISNAKSIGEQPAILANLGLANEVLNINMLNQAAITQQAAMNQIALATMAKCVSLTTQPNEKQDPNTGKTTQSESCVAMLHKIFEEMSKNAQGDPTKAGSHAAAPQDPTPGTRSTPAPPNPEQ